MKYSQKLKNTIKKRLLISLSSITIVLMLVASMKLADFSAPFNRFKADDEQVAGVSEENEEQSNVLPSEQRTKMTKLRASSTERLENTSDEIYIYDVQDLNDFRDSVNAGETYFGMTVYLMADIDMSTVCSSTIGSWTPIGATGISFAGTFDGNYYSIKNLYINTNAYVSIGLFNQNSTTSITRNLRLENVYVNNTYNNATVPGNAGGIVGYNYGQIINCGVDSGSITTSKTAGNSGSSWKCVGAGGIAAVSYNGVLNSCYNKAAIKGTNVQQNYNSAYVGGILGYGSANNRVSNCYNMGSVSAGAHHVSIGGVIGDNLGGTGTTVNCYNYGRTYPLYYTNGILFQSGIIGRGSTTRPSNCYSPVYNNASYYYANNMSSYSYDGRVSDVNTIKTYTVVLGSAYAYDVYNHNLGFPVLAWENTNPMKPEMSLNKNHEYIKVGEKLNLNAVEEQKITETIGDNYAASNFIWKSTNEDVATVDSNGVVTGISDGYTTIYAYHEETKIYAMCVVNVAKEFTNPQIATGNGFTTILKSDGTVWTIGNNASGQIGNGTTTNIGNAEIVKIDEDTNLTGVIKIANGGDHVLALTAEGKVYAWGTNAKGQLGINSTVNANYAKIVLGTDGTSYLTDIVDIDAGGYGSVALDKNGNVYVWGNGTYGEMENKTTTSSLLPVKTKIENGIQVSMGDGTIGALTSDGSVWEWGLNTSGQLGIYCKNNTSYAMKTALNVTELSVGGYHTTVKKVDNKLYSVGCFSYGRQGTNATADTTLYSEVNLPSSVTESNKVKYVKAGIINTTLLLQDGTVWETGFNLQGELGNGNTTTQTAFVQGKTEEGNLENVLTVGKNVGNVAGSLTAGYGLNTAVIVENGDIYTTGDNSYTQIGDNTTTNTSYYKRMGFVYLDYEDKVVEVTTQGYQVDSDKVKYVYSSINAYNNEDAYIVGDLKYTSLNESLVTVDNTGMVAAKEGVSGVTKVKIEDITNGYSTYFTIIANKMVDTDTVMYIYNSNDLVRFRNAVNAGDNFAGKTVYVMADIDMSDVCSETIGSWEPIGITSDGFAGTFDGNYHTISNLYINSNEHVNTGLFANAASTSVIKNIVEKNVFIYNTFGTANSGNNTGGIVGSASGVVLNCGIESGSITSKRSVSTSGTGWMLARAGGIAGISYNLISSCYNKATISASNLNQMYSSSDAGGIVGSCGKVENCYNKGNISGSSRVAMNGGIIGETWGSTYYLKNSYSTGTVTGSGSQVFAAGLIGRNACQGGIQAVMTNNYCSTVNTYSYYYLNDLNKHSTAYRVVPETLKTYASVLGSSYEEDDFNINDEYPILWWEAPTIELDKKQEYIKIDEQMQINIIQDDSVIEKIGKEFEISDFEWSSSNEDIATVDANAKVTGKNEGYTTIYGYNSEYDIYVMCVVNVIADVAVPQVETGEGFTAVLKADGTVWTVGSNEYGQLGDGTNEDKSIPVQVKTDENTHLTNIKKISVGMSHVLALSTDGKVYSWGSNQFGKLGNNSTDNGNYATLVSGEGGSGNLEKIVDISAGSYESAAINQSGWEYVWGNGSYGELGNGTTASISAPIKTLLNTAIQTSAGGGHVAGLSQNGKVYTWGRNYYGQLGNNNTTNSTSIASVAKGVTEVSSAGFETVIKKVDNKVYATGLNTDGQLGNGTKVNKTTFTEVILPDEVTTENKVKYIKAGRTSTALLLEDGSVWTVGNNSSGELGDLTTTSSNSFVQGKTVVDEADQDLEAIMIGRSSGDASSMNITAIKPNGRVVVSGNNDYGQLGNHSYVSKNYFSEIGYVDVSYPEEIRMVEGENLQLSETDLLYLELYLNVYREDIESETLVDKAKSMNNKVATYNNGLLESQNIGNGMLVIKYEDKEIVINIPIRVIKAEGQEMAEIQNGNGYTVALKADGTIWSWGENSKGELGLGDTTSRNEPTLVGVDVLIAPNNQPIDPIIEISTGESHTLALTKEGKVYAWGANDQGQLGNGNTKNNNIPQEVMIPVDEDSLNPVKEKVIKVTATKDTSYVITQNGKVYAWGSGYTKQPEEISIEENIVDITKNYYLTDEGKVKSLNGDREILLMLREYGEGIVAIS